MELEKFKKWNCFLLFFCVAITSLQSSESTESDHNSQNLTEYEKELYLTAGGKYTEKDIAANRSMTRSQKFKNFIPSHNLNPEKGQAICPITLTKANPQCTWIINGKTYQFCCPPCIDEFLALAKTHPEKILEPENYIK